MTAYIGKIDLHTHSNASDGALSPQELVQRAIDRGLTHLALTDHDCVSGIEDAIEASLGRIEIISGSEFSTTWRSNQIHIVGLFLDIKNPFLNEYLNAQNEKRIERSISIGNKLDRLGFKDSYKKTCAQASDGAIITRGNYARFIVSEGRASNTDEAFNVYLKKGKKAYVATQWPDIKEAVSIIHKANGAAVLAHPGRYELTNTKLRELMEYFKEVGGDGIEISSSQQSPSERDYLKNLALRYDFYGSLGSDFHSLKPYRDLGLNLKLPAGIKPIWTLDCASLHNFS